MWGGGGGGYISLEVDSSHKKLSNEGVGDNSGQTLSCVCESYCSLVGSSHCEYSSPYYCCLLSNECYIQQNCCLTQYQHCKKWIVVLKKSSYLMQLHDVTRTSLSA